MHFKVDNSLTLDFCKRQLKWIKSSLSYKQFTHITAVHFHTRVELSYQWCSFIPTRISYDLSLYPMYIFQCFFGTIWHILCSCAVKLTKPNRSVFSRNLWWWRSQKDCQHGSLGSQLVQECSLERHCIVSCLALPFHFSIHKTDSGEVRVEKWTTPLYKFGMLGVKHVCEPWSTLFHAEFVLTLDLLYIEFC